MEEVIIYLGLAVLLFCDERKVQIHRFFLQVTTCNFPLQVLTCELLDSWFIGFKLRMFTFYRLNFLHVSIY